MTGLGVSDIPAMLAAFGQSATFGNLTVPAIVDTPDDDEIARSGIAVIGQVARVRIATGTVPDLEVGAVFAAEGVSYVARDIRRIGDGETTQILCAADPAPLARPHAQLISDPQFVGPLEFDDEVLVTDPIDLHGLRDIIVWGAKIATGDCSAAVAMLGADAADGLYGALAGGTVQLGEGFPDFDSVHPAPSIFKRWVRFRITPGGSDGQISLALILAAAVVR